MPSKYFLKTGAKNSNKRFTPCLPKCGVPSEREMDEHELKYHLLSIKNSEKLQEERFLDWMMDLSWNWDNPMCEIRETTLNLRDPYDGEIEYFWDAGQEQFELRCDADELLRNPNLSSEERTFVQIELAWCIHVGQVLSSHIDTLTWQYGAGVYLGQYDEMDW